MTTYCIPEHTESSFCQCTTQYGATQCSRKAKYRFVYSCDVKYSCGIGLHMKTLTHNTKSYFTQEKNKEGKWRVVEKTNQQSTQSTKETPKENQNTPNTPKENQNTPNTPKENQNTPNTPKETQNTPNNPKEKEYHLEIQRMQIIINNLQSTMRKQSSVIAKQSTTISTLRRIVSTNTSSDTKDVDSCHGKIMTNTKQALLSAQSDGSVKQLKYQLHPDKHPSSLRWLFEEMFKVVNV